MKKLLAVIDYQNDFVDGTLGFSGAEKLEPGILNAVEATLADGGYVLFTRDTHEGEEGYLQTREGEYLPVPHCEAGSHGHALYGGLHRYETEKIAHVKVIDKPTFGCAGIVEEATSLCEGEPAQVSICGVVTDICVIANAVLLHTGLPYTRIAVLAGLCGSGNAEGHEAALKILEGMGIYII